MKQPKRWTSGPRGSKVYQPTPCSECVAYSTCLPAGISAPFGCEGWVDVLRYRAEPDVVEAPDVESFGLQSQATDLIYPDERGSGVGVRTAEHQGTEARADHGPLFS